MRCPTQRRRLLIGVAWCALAAPVIAQAQTAPAQGVSASPPSSETAVGEIMVTAEKRSESINSVPMSITAVTGATLQQRDIITLADLSKVTPGFNYSTVLGQPVYFLRGVGLVDYGLGSSPAVSVYLDEAPIFSPVMTEVAPLDLERVEVLKGPQGTLFGENSTGGAINFIAAKPTRTFEAGADLTYEEYNQLDAQGFVSGPLSDTLSMRLSGAVIQGGAYQYSLTRPGDRLGDTRTQQGRLLLDWRPNDRLRFQLNINGFHDGSDTHANQLVRIQPVNPALASAQFLASPIAPNNDTAADWAPGHPLRANDDFYQIALRTDYDITPDISLTSLTNYENLHQDKLTDQPGVAQGALVTGNPAITNAQLDVRYLGGDSAVSQEFRLNGKQGPLNWIVGANYDHQDIADNQLYTINQTGDQPIPSIPPFYHVAATTQSTVDDYAIFGNADYNLTDNIVLHAGLRGTESRRSADSCVSDFDPTGDNGAAAAVFDALEQAFASVGIKTTPVVLPSPRGCLELSAAPDLTPGPTHNSLNQGNLSYRLGADYKIPSGGLLYVSVSQGYKSGIITPIIASSATEFKPASQEKLNAYEVGIKVPLFERRVHFDGALFYYDYTDKQLLDDEIDPTFGALAILVNIPKSRILGAEADIEAEPIDGLTFNLGATYLDSEVTSNYSNFNGSGNFGNFKGSQLPDTPKVELVADGQYERPVNDAINAFVGASVTYHDQSNATFSTATAPAPLGVLPAYTLVDLRAGIAARDGAWRLSVFGKNITNQFYIVTSGIVGDVYVRSAGLPSVYGVSLSYRWK
jgi:iron complex outermembrane recepter protein